MGQIRFTEPEDVLDKNGHPNPGWASSGILKYNRKAIKAPWYRIKEWDWYQVNNDHLAFQMTFGHASYAGQVGVMLFDFIERRTYCAKDIIIPMPGKKIRPGDSAEKDNKIIYKNERFNFGIRTKDDVRELFVNFQDRRSRKSLDARFTLTRTNPNSLAINIPFDEYVEAFYYNQKISCMKAEGKVMLNGREFDFSKNSWGLLDWGRGVWPFHNEWYWSSASGILGGEVFGINLGAGFGNTKYATENCIFYKDDIHKLGRVNFELGKSYEDPWHLYDDDGRCDLVMEPTYDRKTKVRLLWVDNRTHQMFGRFKGKVVLDDGEELKVDNIVGFAEHAVNNW